MTKRHNWQWLFVSYNLVMGEQHVLNMFVLQAVQKEPFFVLKLYAQENQKRFKKTDTKPEPSWFCKNQKGSKTDTEPNIVSKSNTFPFCTKPYLFQWTFLGFFSFLEPFQKVPKRFFIKPSMVGGIGRIRRLFIDPKMVLNNRFSTMFSSVSPCWNLSLFL